MFERGWTKVERVCVCVCCCMVQDEGSVVVSLGKQPRKQTHYLSLPLLPEREGEGMEATLGRVLNQLKTALTELQVIVDGQVSGACVCLHCEASSSFQYLSAL